MSKPSICLPLANRGSTVRGINLLLGNFCSYRCRVVSIERAASGSVSLIAVLHCGQIVDRSLVLEWISCKNIMLGFPVADWGAS